MTCCIPSYCTYPIPENYTGNLTIGVITEINTAVRIVFKKRDIEQVFTATSDPSGNIVLPITAVENAFFSSEYCDYEVRVYDAATLVPINFTDGTDEYEFICIPFSPFDCDWSDTDITLTINTESIILCQ